MPTSKLGRLRKENLVYKNPLAVGLHCKITICCMQWWILGEANETVASGPPSKIPKKVCFFRDHYEHGPKSKNKRLTRNEDLFFVCLEITMIL